MNYAESAAFWYLRLNGFFPIMNFVVHRSGDVLHTSDCDVLGVRPPNVYEAVGGQDGDWDGYLTDQLDFTRPVGIICEVKSGRYEAGKVLATREVLSYCVRRVGLATSDEAEDIAAHLLGNPVATLDDGTQLAKLLVARHPGEGPFLFRSLKDVHDFLRQRVDRYPREKYSDRMFFGPVLMQAVIEFAAGGVLAPDLDMEA